MTLHLSYEIIFHVGGLKLAVIDIASSRLKVIQFFLDNRKIVFYVSSSRPLNISTSEMLKNRMPTFSCIYAVSENINCNKD